MKIERLSVDKLLLDPSKQLLRFLSKVKIKNGCWEFCDYQKHTGYGKFHTDGKTWRAHRWIMYILGEIEYKDEKCVLHKCDNRKCVNPSHLYLGDRYQNAQDIKLRNRTYLISDPKVGSKNHQAKITENDVLEIRNKLKHGFKGKDLAKQYCVSRTTISEIKHKKVWCHV